MTDKSTNEQMGSESSLISEPLWTRNFIKIWILNLLICIWFFLLSAPFSFYILELGGTELLVGIVAGGYAITSLIIRPAAGWMLDNRSRKELLIWGLLLLTLASLLFIFVPILGVIVIVRIISGFLFASTSTASLTNVYDSITPRRMGEGLGFLGLGNTLAMALAPAVGLAIIAGWGFDILFAVSVLVLLLATVVMKGFPYKKVEKPVRSKKQQGKLWSNISNLISVEALPASVIMMFISVPYGGVSVFIALYGELYGLGSAGLFFTLFAIGTGSTRLFSGRIADKKGEKPMIAIGSSLLFISLMLLLTTNSFWYYTSGLLYGIGSGVMLPTMQAMSMRTVPAEKRGVASSTYQCSYDIASGAGGFIAGWIVTVWGYKPMFAALGIFPVIAVLVYAFWASKTPSAFRVYKRNLKETVNELKIES